MALGKVRTISIILSLLMWLVLGQISLVQALTVEPAIIDQTVTPQTQVSFEFTFSNPDPNPIELEFSASDITFTEDGQIVPTSNGGKPFIFASNIDFPAKLLVPAGAVLQQTITLSTPARLAGTSGYGALLIHPRPAGETEVPEITNSIQVFQQIMVPILLEGINPAQIAALEFKNFHLPKFRFDRQIDVQSEYVNTGTVHLKPHGQLTFVRWPFGAKAEARGINDDFTYLFPTAHRRVSETWQSASWLPLQLVTVELTLSAKNIAPIERRQTVLLMPWQSLLITLIVITIVIKFFLMQRLRR